MNIFDRLIYFDKVVGEIIVSSRTSHADSFYYKITWLGEWQVIFFFFLITGALFMLYSQRKFIWPFLVAIIGTGVMTVLIKYLVGRARPGVGIALYVEKLPSFPSAHASLSFAFYGFLVYCLWKSHFRLIFKIVLSIFLFLIIYFVGYSRIYLGVHFLSDVIAGYLVGLLWVLIAMYCSHRRVC